MKAIFTTRVYPVIDGTDDKGAARVIETVAEYRLLGLPVYRKTVEHPLKWGHKSYTNYRVGFRLRGET
jgi:hypothetical protein